MSRSLRRIAVVGLSIGVVSLAIAYALGGRDLYRLWDRHGLTLQACSHDKAKADSGSERRLAWNHGAAIDVALPATVHWRAGEGTDVVVRGSPDTIASVELRNGRLTLNCRWIAASRDIEVSLPGDAFNRVGISGAGKVIMENLNQPQLRLSISGRGSVTAQGAVDRLTVAVSGSGKARLGEVAVKQLTVEVSGSGTVEASPRDEADIHISGSGNVKLLSRPLQLRSHIAGSGRMVQPPIEAADKK